MKPITSLKEFRTRVGMTQEKLAIFLHTSRTLVAMAETGRRSLPMDAIRRLQELEESTKQAPNLTVEQREELIDENAQIIADNRAEWAYKEKTANFYKFKLERRLCVMAKLYEETLAAYNAYSLLLKDLPHDTPESKLLFMKFQFSEMKRKLNTCNEGCQQKLQAKIELCSREEEVMKSFLTE